MGDHIYCPKCGLNNCDCLPPIVIVVTGSRYADYSYTGFITSKLDQVASYLTGRDVILRQGEARGVDSICKNHAENLGWTVESFPANWDEYGKAAGHIRNDEMLTGLVNLVVAFPHSKLPSVGTWNAIRTAVSKRFPVRIYPL